MKSFKLGRNLGNLLSHDISGAGRPQVVGGIWAASLSISAPYAVRRGATSLIAGGKPTWRELLLRMTMPRTVIFGEKLLPDEDTQRLPQQRIAISVVPQAGHSMAWENPAGLAGAMRKALS